MEFLKKYTEELTSSGGNTKAEKVNLEPQSFKIQPKDYNEKTGEWREKPGVVYEKAFEPLGSNVDVQVAELMANELAQFTNIEKGESIAKAASMFLHQGEQLITDPDGSILLASDIFVEDAMGVQFVHGDAENVRLPFDKNKRNSAIAVEDALKKAGRVRSGPIHMQGCHFTNKRMLILDVSFYKKTQQCGEKIKEESGPEPNIKAENLNDNTVPENLKQSGVPEMKKARAESIITPISDKTLNSYLVASFRTFRSIWLGEDVIDAGLDMASVHQAAFSRKQGSLTTHTSAETAKAIFGFEQGSFCYCILSPCCCCCAKDVEKKAASSNTVKLPVDVERRDYLSSADSAYRKVTRILNISTLRHGEVIVSLAETVSFAKVAKIIAAISPESPPEAFYTKQPSIKPNSATGN
eukprot:UC4_evm2s89